MRFEVFRASPHSSAEPPCAGAIAEVVEGRMCWYIEVADLPALMTFADEYGDVIVSPVPEGDDTPSITIYDYYLE